ncbi:MULTISPECIES: DUF7511 domain-containing protein [Natrialba]|uniref:DUF7511 domain-containing protein n=1 Tax=Natrialba aegyptia DSM 13077 TaxID=1227491 RepID=M0BAM1_9EURY|nr:MULTISPECIES: hypothetical protein [Natrialba]ELZ07497.1 hypothetical protein C480_05556 [Natrialba aegyptia DSM 13077]
MTHDADSWSSDTTVGDEQSTSSTVDDANAPVDPDARRQTHDTGPELDHVRIDNGDSPDECAIFPADAPEEELMSNWIAATQGSFVDLESIR